MIIEMMHLTTWLQQEFGVVTMVFTVVDIYLIRCHVDS